jgi:hypothetical protein
MLIRQDRPTHTAMRQIEHMPRAGPYPCYRGRIAYASLEAARSCANSPGPLYRAVRNSLA